MLLRSLLASGLLLVLAAQNAETRPTQPKKVQIANLVQCGVIDERKALERCLAYAMKPTTSYQDIQNFLKKQPSTAFRGYDPKNPDPNGCKKYDCN